MTIWFFINKYFTINYIFSDLGCLNKHKVNLKILEGQSVKQNNLIILLKYKVHSFFELVKANLANILLFFHFQFLFSFQMLLYKVIENVFENMYIFMHMFYFIQ